MRNLIFLVAFLLPLTVLAQRYPSGGNASVGINGSPIPLSSDLAGAENPSGFMEPLQVDSSGNLLINLNAGGGTLNTNVSQWGGTNTTLGQKTMSASVPVALASDQSAIPVSQSGTWNLNNISGAISLPTGASTSALQTSGNSQLVSIASNQTNGTQVTAVNNFPATQPVSGAVTANQGTANATPWNDNVSQWGGSATTLGSKVSASSVPVVIASDQASVAITDGTLDLYFTGPTAATQVINTNLLTNPTSTNATDFQGYRSISFQINTGASTTAVAVNFEASDDNVNFIAIGMYDKTTPGAAPVTTFTTAASTFRYFEGPLTLRYFRVKLVAAITAGTVQAFSIARKESYVPPQMSLAAGTQVIGALSANQSTNVAQINGVAPLMGNGVTGTGSLRVTIASDTTANSNAFNVNQTGRVQANAPVRNPYSSTNVTTAAYVQMVASTTAAARVVCIFDSSGQDLVLAVGAAASEVDQMGIFPGGNGCEPIAIPAASRITLKAKSATASSGVFLLNLYQ